MEKQTSVRVLMERQKSFRIAMERHKFCWREAKEQGFVGNGGFTPSSSCTSWGFGEGEKDDYFEFWSDY